jgi:hypothetical protein
MFFFAPVTVGRATGAPPKNPMPVALRRNLSVRLSDERTWKLNDAARDPLLRLS